MKNQDKGCPHKERKRKGGWGIWDKRVVDLTNPMTNQDKTPTPTLPEDKVYNCGDFGCPKHLPTDIDKEFDEKFPLVVNEYNGTNDCGGLEISGEKEGGIWLEYDVLCKHDDFTICSKRMEPIKQFLADKLAEERNKLYYEEREKGVKAGISITTKRITELGEGMKAFTDYPDTKEGRQCRHENMLFNSALDQFIKKINSDE